MCELFCPHRLAVRTSALQAEDRGFESRWGRHCKYAGLVIGPVFYLSEWGMRMGQFITRDHVSEAVAYIRNRADIEPRAIGIVLGSGFGELAEALEDLVALDYSDVPYMVGSTAPLHHGRFIIGRLDGRPVICMQGRLHAYEGNTAQQIAFPICVLHELGVMELIVTNAAGGINAEFNVGDLMLIDDQINLLGKNPCAGEEQGDLWPRFFDMTHAYSPEMRRRAREAADECGITLKHGVYIATLGPSFETPAEIRAFRTLGADAVGMSTVFEVIAANALGMDVLGISMISNPAAGVLEEPLSMDDVTKAALASAQEAGRLMRTIITST